jgi:phage-related protein
MVSGKMIKQVSDKLGVTQKDALCILVLDDFWPDVKEKLGTAWDTAKQFVADNKDTVHSWLGNLITSVLPQARPVFDAAWTAFGGKL